MELNGKINLLNQTVSIEKSAIRTNAIMAVSILILSLTGSVLLYKLTGTALDSTSKLITSVCTALTSFLSGIPASTIPGKKVRIAVLSYLEEQYKAIQNNPAQADPQQITDLEKRFSTILDKHL